MPRTTEQYFKGGCRVGVGVIQGKGGGWVSSGPHMHRHLHPVHSNLKGRKQGSGPSSRLQENTFICLLIPASRAESGKSLLGSWKERPIGNIGNWTGRCRYVPSGGCLWCLKGTTPPDSRLQPETTEGLLAGNKTQRGLCFSWQGRAGQGPLS